MKNDSKSDIADRQLPTVDTPHNESEWTEIGTAEITQSIFGKARVHIIRQHDKARRAWFLTALVVSLMVTAVAAVIWQEQNAPLASTTAPAPQLSVLPEANAPASPVVAIPATVLPLMEEGKPGAPTAIDNPAASRVPQKILSVNTAEHTTAILATNNNAAKSQTDMQQLPKLSAPLVPPTTPSATQPEGGNQLADPINAQHN